DRVSQGQPIGLVGSSGRATGPHLHWSLKWQDARLDPLLFTGSMPD
ncbi:MAG TPA: M23 family metallopeptidase, partial [Croceicoccus sp.]|nr:M23 family metallopeptidase [Croceicoccus sp.]